MPKTWIATPVAEWLANHGHFNDLTGYTRKKGRGGQTEIEVTAAVIATLTDGLKSRGEIGHAIRTQAHMALDRMVKVFEGQSEAAA